MDGRGGLEAGVVDLDGAVVGEVRSRPFRGRSYPRDRRRLVYEHRGGGRAGIVPDDRDRAELREILETIGPVM